VRYLTNRSSGKMGYALAEARRREARAWCWFRTGEPDASAGVEVIAVRTRRKCARGDGEPGAGAYRDQGRGGGRFI